MPEAPPPPIHVPRLLIALLLLLAGFATCAAGGVPPSAMAPLLSGMGTYPIMQVSSQPQAQRFFRQGMTETWGFNPAEAARAFDAALAADPSCAMCAWGIAWALGPNINADMAPGSVEQVDRALARARALAPRASVVQRALIAALSARHRGGPEPDEAGYARTMQQLARRFPEDADVATLAAEALLNLHPYDWWRPDGTPQPWTPPIEHLLERALRIEPDHPGANHYWIHLEERSPHPERALTSARRLDGLVPGSGHLLHMPAHVYMRLGRYAEASAASERAIAADARYVSEVTASGAYRVGYVAHNDHFLWASASMQGRSAVALQAARAAYPSACGPGKADRSTGLLQHYYVLPLYALVRFGHWQEILTDTLPPDVAEPYPMAIWHYARGTALARLGRMHAARAELREVQALARAPALDRARIKNINRAGALVQIAALTLEADIALAQGRGPEAVMLLARATATEDALAYDEPHLWLAPTRQALGAALLSAHRPAEAERAFREDLRRYPENGWSLIGLALALRQQGRRAEADAVARREAIAWRAADIRLTAPRF